MSEGDPTGPARAEPILGSYRLVQSLGTGGMSSVFRAVHVESGHEVAVKVLPRALARNPTSLQRFLREARSAEGLDHPNIVAIYDRGVDQGRHYLVLEYVAGGDLFDRVKAGGPLPIAEAVAVARAVAEALRYAAGKGLIHRDIKPANILVSPSGQVKLIDLGLALQAEDEDERVTRAGMTVGTVDFMAPEQARDSRATSVRSDIYSLGCTLYFLLTGQAPFPGGDIAEKLSRHFTEAPPDPKKLRPEVPRDLALLVQRMMAKRPERRPQDYDQLIAALDAAPTDPAASAAPVLTALFDDEDDDAPESGEQPLFALIDDEEDDDEEQMEKPLFALIDDDDEGGGDAPKGRRGRAAPRRVLDRRAGRPRRPRPLAHPGATECPGAAPLGCGDPAGAPGSRRARPRAGGVLRGGGFRGWDARPGRLSRLAGVRG